jgi:hypothetical protein
MGPKPHIYQGDQSLGQQQLTNLHQLGIHRIRL